MKRGILFGFLLFAFLISLPLASHAQLKPGNLILSGASTSLKLIEGSEGNKTALLTVEEINAKRGGKAGKKKRLFKIESIDIWDSEFGIPNF